MPEKLKKARVTINNNPSKSKELDGSHLGNNKDTILIDDESSDTVSVCEDSEGEDALRLAKPLYQNKKNEKPCPLFDNKDDLLSGKPGHKAPAITGDSRSIIRSRTSGSSLSPRQVDDIRKFGGKDKFFEEKDVKKPGAVEVFCGCARMTKELQSAGFNAVGVDYRYNKDKPETKAYVELDLARPWGMLCDQLWKVRLVG